MQTSYSAQAAVGFAGLEVDTRPSVKTTGINEETSAIPFGVAVKRGTAGDQAKLPAAATDVIVGVAVTTAWSDNQALAGALGIAADTGVFSIMEKGACWVKVEEIVARGDQAFVRFTSDGGSNTQLGSFRKSVDSGRARRLKNAHYDSAAAAGGYAILVIDGPLDEVDDVGPVLFQHAENADAGDQVNNLFKTPADRYLVIDSVDYVNPTGLAGHGTNYGVIAVKHGSTTAASWSTLDTAQGTLTAATTVALVLAALASRVVPPATQVLLSVSEQGTTTVPVGIVAIKGHYI